MFNMCFMKIKFYKIKLYIIYKIYYKPAEERKKSSSINFQQHYTINLK